MLSRCVGEDFVLLVFKIFIRPYNLKNRYCVSTARYVTNKLTIGIFLKKKEERKERAGPMALARPERGVERGRREDVTKTDVAGEWVVRYGVDMRIVGTLMELREWKETWHMIRKIGVESRCM